MVVMRSREALNGFQILAAEARVDGENVAAPVTNQVPVERPGGIELAEHFVHGRRIEKVSGDAALSKSGYHGVPPGGKEGHHEIADVLGAGALLQLKRAVRNEAGRGCGPVRNETLRTGEIGRHPEQAGGGREPGGTSRAGLAAAALGPCRRACTADRRATTEAGAACATRYWRYRKRSSDWGRGSVSAAIRPATLRAASALRNVTAPPGSSKYFLKLNTETSPIDPTRRPPILLWSTWAQSSMRSRLCADAARRSSSAESGLP